MRLLFVGDIHLSDKPPSTRTADYSEHILAKLREVHQIAIDRDVQAIVLAGDVFHSKVPHRTSHELVQRTIAVMRSSRRPVFAVPGNHDYSGANHMNLDKSPLGSVAAAGAITLFGLDNRRLVKLPPPPTAPTLWGVREEEGLDAFRVPSTWSIPGVVVAHSPIFPPGEDPPFEHLKAEDVAAVMGQVRHEQLPTQRWATVLYGHIHEPHGVYEVDGVRFVNPGSLSRGSLWEADPYRVPQVALVTNDSVEMIPLTSALPFDEVFRVAEEHHKRDRSLAAAQFAAELAAATIDVFDVERVVAVIRARDDVTSAVKERAIALIESVS